MNFKTATPEEMGISSKNIQKYIDTYFGRLKIDFGFEGKGIGIKMVKTAEDFLKEYEGFAGGFYE